MNIKEIRFENFKNIKNSIIEFRNNLSGIYGPNGTGKAFIVEVLKLYFRNTSKYRNDILFYFRGPVHALQSKNLKIVLNSSNV